MRHIRRIISSWVSSHKTVSYIWVTIVVLYVPVLFASFFIFDQIVRAEYFNHRAAWEADGQPHGIFWVPQECRLAGGWLIRLGSSVAKHNRWRGWLFSTPAWMKRDQHTLHLLYWWRGLMIGWNSACVVFMLFLIFR